MNFQVGEVVLYGTEGICKVLGTEEKRFGNEALMYYVLQSCAKGSRIFVPFANENLVNRIRKPLSKEEMAELLSSVEALELLPWCENDRERKTLHMAIVANKGAKDLLSLAKTIEYRRVQMQENGKKLYAFDDRICRDALALLICEIEYVFSADKENAKKMLIESWAAFAMLDE